MCNITCVKCVEFPCAIHRKINNLPEAGTREDKELIRMQDEFEMEEEDGTK
jgi:hypothetical protein